MLHLNLGHPNTAGVFFNLAPGRVVVIFGAAFCVTVWFFRPFVVRPAPLLPSHLGVSGPRLELFCVVRLNPILTLTGFQIP